MEAATTAPEDASADENAQPQDGGAKRRQILDGARTVFLSDGFDGASMNDIARVAGVSKGTLYVYFESKEELFEALIREDRKQQAERLDVRPRNGKTRANFSMAYGRRLIEMMTRPEMLAQSRMVISAIAKFPRFGQAFFEAGPLLRRCAGSRRGFESSWRAGELEIEDVELAAQQFAELCKAGIFHRVIFCGADAVEPEEIERTVDGRGRGVHAPPTARSAEFSRASPLARLTLACGLCL